jgi:hypothetical protein
MEHKSLWKNFLLLTIGGLLALHINVVSAADNSDDTTSSDASDSCVLPAE